MLISNVFDSLSALLGFSGTQDTPGTMVVKNFDRGAGTFWAERGDLGIALDDFNPLAALSFLAPRLAGVPIAQSKMAALMALAAGLAAQVLGLQYRVFAKESGWIEETDPLVIDLDGDGIETVAMRDSKVFFDVDGDLFAQRTGWLKGDDGFLVLDANGNGRIEDIAEMFGGVGRSGFAELATLDSAQNGGNGDGKITIADAAFAGLKVWQDRDRDGATDVGELKTLAELGIVSLDVTARPLEATTPQGARLTGYGEVTFASGVRRTMFDAILAANDTDTRYAGESGRAEWQGASTLDARGFGRIADLSVAMANDVGLAELASATAAAMTSYDLRTLVAQAGKVLGKWGASLELTRELYAVRLSADPVSGAGAGGKTLLERKAWHGAALEAGWTLEQGWSPSDRAAPLTPREAAQFDQQSRRAAAASNDNSAWPERPFRMSA